MATAQQSQSAAQRAQQQAAQNAAFMQYSYEQPFRANAQNGNSYVAGTSLNYDAPVVSGGYLSRIILSVTLDVNYTAAGTGPVAPALTAGGIWNVINQINVKFGETQITVHPYFEHIFGMMRGYDRAGTTGVVGNQVSNIQAILYSAPTFNAGDNTWKFDIEIPLNAAHPSAVNGMLPVGQTGTKVQIQVVPASAFHGPDPLQNVEYATNGTLAVSGSVDVTCMVRDFKSFASTNFYQPDLSGLATVQTIKPAEINPLTAGSYSFRSIQNPYPVIRMASIIIDGQSSGTFCAASNIEGIELDQAENTNSAFYRYDDTTGGMSRYYQETRRKYGQDLPEGVVAWVDAPTHNVANPSSLNGESYLNLTGQGFPAARYGVKVSSTSSANNITPRVVTYAQILNPAGIQLA